MKSRRMAYTGLDWFMGFMQVPITSSPCGLGGYPRNIKNLILQHWESPNGIMAKDRLVRRLQQLVCAGKVPLDDARRAIYLDWQEAARSYAPFSGRAP